MVTNHLLSGMILQAGLFTGPPRIGGGPLCDGDSQQRFLEVLLHDGGTPVDTFFCMGKTTT